MDVVSTIGSVNQEVLLDNLITTLEELASTQQQFLTILQLEKRLVIEGDLDELLSCLADKEKVLAHLTQLETQRQNLMRPLAKGLQQNVHSLTLKQLSDQVGEPYATRLNACHHKLKVLSSSIEEVNQINGLLIDKTLKQVSCLLGLLRHLSTSPPLYQASGLTQEVSLGGKVLGKG